jgi:hypothetical protein
LTAHYTTKHHLAIKTPLCVYFISTDPPPSITHIILVSLASPQHYFTHPSNHPTSTVSYIMSIGKEAVGPLASHEAEAEAIPPSARKLWHIIIPRSMRPRWRSGLPTITEEPAPPKSKVRFQDDSDEARASAHSNPPTARPPRPRSPPPTPTWDLEFLYNDEEESLQRRLPTILKEKPKVRFQDVSDEVHAYAQSQLPTARAPPPRSPLARPLTIWRYGFLYDDRPLDYDEAVTHLSHLTRPKSPYPALPREEKENTRTAARRLCHQALDALKDTFRGTNRRHRN